MPANGSIDAGLNDAGVDLDKLDKQATKALKALQKERKALDKAQQIREGTGAFRGADVPIGKGAPADIGKKTKTLNERIDERSEILFREEFADQAGGFRGTKNLFAFAKNPKAFAVGLLKSIPFIGGVVAAADFAQAIIAEIEKIDRFFKKFIPIIDNRINQLRPVEQQANIRAGDTQLILTTEAGGTEPRESYNTFNEFNKNRIQIESEFAVRDTSGV